jgi:hypothetical protein
MAQVQFQLDVVRSPEPEYLKEEGVFIRQRASLGHEIFTTARGDAGLEGLLTPRATVIEELPVIREGAFTLATDRTHAEGLYQDLELHHELPSLVSIQPLSYPLASSEQRSTDGLALYPVSPVIEGCRIEHRLVCDHDSTEKRPKTMADRLTLLAASTLCSTTVHPLLGLFVGFLNAIDG